MNSLIYVKNETGEKIQSKYLVTEVYLTSVEEMQELFALVLDSGIDIILALFTETKNGVVILTYIPESQRDTLTADDFFTRIVSPMKLIGIMIHKPAQSENQLFTELKLEGTEYYPEKVLSQGVSNAFHVLKLKGVHKEDEEEKEYDFEDIL